MIYSTQFFSGTFPASPAFITLTVPATETWVLREIDYSGSGGDHLWINFTPVSGSPFTLGEDIPATYTNYAQWTGRLVCPPNSTLELFSDAGTVGAILSGYRLT